MDERMTRPMPIPPEVVEAARDAIFNDKGMEGIIQAALAAWPGARVGEPVPTFEQPGRLILPLPPKGETP